jgi:hypothetical protein
MNNYILSYTKKMDHFFGHKEVSSIIYLHDEEDNERLDHVIFLEKDDGDVTGMFIRGMNPLISANRIHDVDDFNLFASYDELMECKENITLKIEYMCLFFSSEYNELLGVYLSNNDNSSSLFLLFLQDEMVVKKDCSKSDVSKILKNMYPTVGYIPYEKRHEGEWNEMKLYIRRTIHENINRKEVLLEKRVKKINSLFKYQADHNEGSPEFESYMAFLRGLRDYSTLLDFYGIEFIDILLETLPKINDKDNKASIIETIVEAYYGLDVEKDLIEKLFNEYISLLSQYATTIKEAGRCLKGFIELGISDFEIIVRIARFEDKQYASALLPHLGVRPWGELPPELSAFQEEVVYAQRIRRRTYIFTQFLVIVHPLISKYERVSSINFVFDYEGAHIDWPFSQAGSSSMWVEEHIIDEAEGAIFEKLGKFIHDSSVDLQLASILNLYQELLKGRDPFDVIFTLPNVQ